MAQIVHVHLSLIKITVLYSSVCFRKKNRNLSLHGTHNLQRHNHLSITLEETQGELSFLLEEFLSLWGEECVLISSFAYTKITFFAYVHHFFSFASFRSSKLAPPLQRFHRRQKLSIQLTQPKFSAARTRPSQKDGA